MTRPERTTGTHVELYARETLPSPAGHRRDRVEEHLADLAAGSGNVTYDVHTWPKRIPCGWQDADPARAGDDRTDDDNPQLDDERDSDDRAARDRYLAFAAWAHDSDVRLTPFFDTRECYSMVTGDRGDWIVLPALCLAVYGDDGLDGVYPHADGDRFHSVRTGLGAIGDAHGTDSPETTAPTTAD